MELSRAVQTIPQPVAHRRDAESGPLDVPRERNIISQALLKATADLVGGREPADLLARVCDALATTSPHIRLAWMILGDLDAEVLRPHYAAGPAKAYADTLAIDSGAVMSLGPTRQAIRHWQPMTGDITRDEAFSSLRTAAMDAGVLSVLCLPVGERDSSPRGIISIYAARADYFTAVGAELFTAFVNVVNASLEQDALVDRLLHMATHDQLTGALNRRGLQERIDAELTRSRRHGKPFALILLDIDRFKLVNDGFGHRAGDMVLKRIAQATADFVRGEDVVGRWGGEEFLCLLPETPSDEAALIAERMRAQIAATAIDVGTTTLSVTASFGYACYPRDGEDPDRLIASADGALYQAKYSGRDRVVGAAGLGVSVHSMANLLDAAVREGRIVAAYQPIIDLATGMTVAEEALARIVTPEGEILEAGKFIDAASRLQLLHRVDHAILSQAFAHCVTGLQGGMSSLSHFVNISADLLRHREMVEQLLDAARAHCSACAGLIGETKPMVIEITERELLNDIDTALELLTPFIDFGLRLALDDFGSGYSSYQYLAALPISFIKIDGDLIRRLHDPKVCAIVEGMQETADKLGITTLAEFVEDDRTEAILKKIGVNWAQGYYYGSPRVP
jgi:diguanylate cyclase (GGDEF)-like protein